MLTHKKYKSAFTLIELVLVIALIAVLAGGTVLLINPAKRFEENRNAQRTADVAVILNATYQYYIDNNGNLPSVIQEDNDCQNPSVVAEICKTEVANLICLANQKIPLYDLTTNQKYLMEIPTDPHTKDAYGTGYNIVKNDNKRITVCAPYAENNIISISR